jgi:putative ABC transport system substrate-binding protein
MKKAALLSILVVAVQLAVEVIADAQQPTKMPHVGYLAGGSLAPPQAFVKALRDLGYVEGSNIAVDFRTTDGNSERNFDVAAELVQLQVDIIVADGSGPSLAAKKATSTIPIVMTTSTDPVTGGLVASLARPGGNITGLIRVNGASGEKLAGLSMIGELLVSGKRLSLLKEILPKISRVGLPIGLLIVIAICHDSFAGIP